MQAAAETTGVWGRKKDVRRVCHCKEVGLQEWSLAGRVAVPPVLYGIGPRRSLRQRAILSKSLPAPARVVLTIIRAHFSHGRAAGRRFVWEEVRIW